MTITAEIVARALACSLSPSDLGLVVDLFEDAGATLQMRADDAMTPGDRQLEQRRADALAAIVEAIERHRQTVGVDYDGDAGSDAT